VFDLAGAESLPKADQRFPSTCAANSVCKCRQYENMAAPSSRSYPILELGAAIFSILAKWKVPLEFL